jgi:hypothetical protein
MTLFLFLSIPAVLQAVDERTIQETSANGTRNTRPFTVQDRWELQWDAKGESFLVMLFTDTGERQGLLPIVRQEGPGKGESFYPKGGSYYLKILAKGDWTVRVVQLP